MDLSRNLEILAIKNLDKTHLADLEARVDGSIIGTSFSEQDVLNTYLGWLGEQLVQDAFFQQDSLVEAWTKSLYHRGFDKKHIHQSFKQWQRREALRDPSTLRRLLMAEQELCDLLDNMVSRDSTGFLEAQDRHTSYQKENKPPHPEKGRSKSKKLATKERSRSEDRRVGKQRTGANDIPVTTRRQLGPPAAKEEIIEIELDNTSETGNRSNSVTPNVLGTQGVSGLPCNSEDLMITRKTILIDTAPRKASHGLYLGDTPRERIDHRGDYISTVRYSVLQKTPPGHWVHLCPTNLDPSFDVPPAKNYRCIYCQRLGDHFATLCPHNEHEWSLTQQRKHASLSTTPKRSQDRGRSPRSGGGSSNTYRPKDVPPRSSYEAADKFRPQYRDNRSRSPPHSASDETIPLSPLHDKKKSKRPSKRTRARRAARRRLEETFKGKKAHTPHPVHYAPADYEGRLFYDDCNEEDPFITITDAPAVGNVKVQTPQTAANEPPFWEPSPECSVKAAAEANDFLQNLQEQIRDDMVEAACSRVLDEIVDEVCGEEDALLFKDGNNVLCKKVTSPPFYEEVVRLFAKRPNPVVCPRPRRALVLEFWEDTVKEEF
ncbi:hypothetical protein TruAng_004527 [Truncatella angustata]|nr:hypothetical protein TruAng_004527 [Truncatella angustata]